MSAERPLLREGVGRFVDFECLHLPEPCVHGERTSVEIRWRASTCACITMASDLIKPMSDSTARLTFLRAALVPRSGSHGDGDLTAANTMLDAIGADQDRDLFVAATLGDMTVKDRAQFTGLLSSALMAMEANDKEEQSSDAPSSRR